MKVNENVKAANVPVGGVYAPSSAPDNTSDFSDVLLNASGKNNDTVKSVQKRKDPVENANSRDAITQKDTARDDRNVNESACDSKEDITKANSVKEDAGVDKGESVNNSVPAEDEVAGIDEKNFDYDEVVEVISSLLNEISELLHISVEQLTDKLGEMDLSVSDLFDPNQVKQIFLDVNQVDSTALLTDENLNLELQQLMELVHSSLDVVNRMGVNESDLSGFGSVKELMEGIIGEKELNSSVALSDLKQDDSMNLMQNEEGVNEPGVLVEDARMTKNHNFGDRNTQSGEELEYDLKEDITGNPRVNTKENSFENPFLQGLQESLDRVNGLSSVSETSAVGSVHIIEQIVEQVKIQLNQDSTSMQMQLYPEHLGKIQINVVSKDGIMTAHIVAENEAAKQAIEGGLASLRDAMEQQNIKVEAIEVMVSTTGFERGNESGESAKDNPKSKPGRKIDISGLDENDLTEEDIAEVERMKATGSSVSYSI